MKCGESAILNLVLTAFIGNDRCCCVRGFCLKRACCTSKRPKLLNKRAEYRNDIKRRKRAFTTRSGRTAGE